MTFFWVERWKNWDEQMEGNIWIYIHAVFAGSQWIWWKKWDRRLGNESIETINWEWKEFLEFFCGKSCLKFLWNEIYFPLSQSPAIQLKKCTSSEAHLSLSLFLSLSLPFFSLSLAAFEDSRTCAPKNKLLYLSKKKKKQKTETGDKPKVKNGGAQKRLKQIDIKEEIPENKKNSILNYSN